MAYVTLDLLYDKIVKMEREMHELRNSLVPLEKISQKEHAELDGIFAQMQEGKATNWRQAKKR